MKSEISYLPIDVNRNRAFIVGPELREEKNNLFLTLQNQYNSCLEEILSHFSKYPLAFNSLTQGIDFNDLSGSNYLFANYFSCFSGKKQINLMELEGILNVNKNAFLDFYVDLSELVLVSNKTSSEKNKYILEHLINQVKYCGYEFSPENPLVIPSPKIILDNENFNKGYGILLELKQDPYYDLSLVVNRESVILGGVENTLNSAKNGINRISFMENELTIGPDLTQSCENGRIVIIKKN